MPITDEMEEKLRAAFAPRRLLIVDDSESHRGHAGYQEGGESHFQITIEAEAFKPMTRIARHRAVHAALGPGIISRIHALALDIKA